MLNEGLLITSIAENDSYQDVIERIISECVTVREIMEESADKLEDHLVLGSEETKYDQCDSGLMIYETPGNTFKTGARMMTSGPGPMRNL